MPLANDYRPEKIEDMIGQTHLLGKGKPISRFIENNFIPNMIFYGPPGTGKTTLAKILAKMSDKIYYEINGVKTSTEEIKEMIKISKKENSLLVFIDEIQYLNKKTQQLILESVEMGDITLIASTADNPYFTIYKALISRCVLFEFKAIQKEDINKNLKRVLKLLCEKHHVKISKESQLEETLSYLSEISNGDVRNSLNNLELCFYMGLTKEEVIISLENAKEVASVKINYDKDGDNHYDLLSAFHKSMRGSDTNAALHYLARLLTGEGILNDICRRILCVASEDVGLANPQAISVVKSCVDSALLLGMPEARLPLAEAVIFLCLQPKSNSVYLAIDKALEDIKNGNYKEIPNYLKDSHYEGAITLTHGIEYKYPHNYENHWIKQEYLQEEKEYYIPQSNKTEIAYQNYWNKIKNINK